MLARLGRRQENVLKNVQHADLHRVYRSELLSFCHSDRTFLDRLHRVLAFRFPLLLSFRPKGGICILPAAPRRLLVTHCHTSSGIAGKLQIPRVARNDKNIEGLVFLDPLYFYCALVTDGRNLLCR